MHSKPPWKYALPFVSAVPSQPQLEAAEGRKDQMHVPGIEDVLLADRTASTWHIMVAKSRLLASVWSCPKGAFGGRMEETVAARLALSRYDDELRPKAARLPVARPPGRPSPHCGLNRSGLPQILHRTSSWDDEACFETNSAQPHKAGPWKSGKQPLTWLRWSWQCLAPRDL